MIDFKQDKFGISGKVKSIEKDPYRSVLIALVIYKDGEKRYILANEGLKVGMEVITDEKVPFQEGNRAKLKNIPLGTSVFNVEMIVGKGGQMARSAGTSVTLMGIEEGMAQLKLSSGEIRLVKSECYATIGQASNFEHNAFKIGKAGRKRRMGIRPTVRGSAMNPVDHPHGGGEGRQPVGLKYPKTPWGRNAFGVKTRKKNKHSSKYIIKRRK
jgi:large subunit ribosomal protein L2